MFLAAELPLGLVAPECTNLAWVSKTVSDRHADLAGLMRAANAGDEAAYRRLLEALASRLRALARARLAKSGADTSASEDIVQETLLAIHLKRHTWDEAQPLEPWVFAIARHKIADHFRRKGNRHMVDIDEVADALSAVSDIDPGQSIDCADLMNCLQDRQREIVAGVSIEGRSAREVGDRLGMSEGAVRVALHRALKQLAQAYRQDETT